MNEHLQTAFNAIKDRFAAQEYLFRDETSAVIAPDQVEAVCRTLRDEFDFELLSEQTAVDYWPQEIPRFHVIMRLRSLKHNTMIGLRIPLNGNSPSIPTIEKVYPNANWFERELFDMFGIKIEGHSDLRRILMPQDWQGHPLRKDFPLGYEEIQFSFNFDEVDERKPYAKE